MALFLSEQARRVRPQVNLDDAEGGVVPFEFVVPSAVAATDVIELGTVQDGFIPVSVQCASATGGALVAGNFGYLNEDKTAIATVLATLADGAITPCLAAALNAGDGANRAVGVVGMAATAAMVNKSTVFSVVMQAA